MKTPKSWADVTIAQYYNLTEAISMDWETDTDKAIAMLSALSGISIKALNEDVSVEDLKKAIKNIVFIGEGKPKGTPRPYLKVGKRRFEVDLILRESAASSFISLSELSKENANLNIHSIMAVFCYEKNWIGFRKKKTASSEKEIAEYFKANMTMDKAFIYSGFFLRSFQALYKAMLGYSELKNREAMKMLKKEIALNS
jgi:hypothetical protein